MLTALLTFLCAVYSYFKMPAGTSPKAFVALILLLESGTLATFAVLDLLLFFLAFEMVLIPMYFLIARWGGAGKQAAASKFVLYTLLGSVVMLLGLLLVGLHALHLRHGGTRHRQRPGPLHVRAGHRRSGDRDRARGEDPDVAAAQLAARRAHRRPHGGLGPPRRM